MLTVIKADITTLHVDAIVNAALGLRRSSSAASPRKTGRCTRD